jgi:hypothetical protein
MKKAILVLVSLGAIAAVAPVAALARVTSVNCGRLPSLGNSYQTQAGPITATGVSCSQARGTMHGVLDQIFGYPMPGQVYTRGGIWSVKTKQITSPRYEDPFLRVTLTHGRQSVVADVSA